MNQDDNTRRDETATSSVFRRYGAELLCALLLMLMAANMLTVVRQKSITIDETLMIPAGYYHLTVRDFRPINEHPPFAKILGALPLVFLGAQAPLIDPRAEPTYNYYYDLLEQFWLDNAADYEAFSFWSRVPLIILTLLLGTLVFGYAQRLFGTRAAIFALALFTLEPTVLAHGRVVQTDIPSALAYLLFTFTLYDYLKGPTYKRAFYVGLVAGLAVVTKFSMVVLGPLLVLSTSMLLMLAPRLGQKRARLAAHAAVVALAAVLAINAAYLFHNRTPDDPDKALAMAGFSPPLEAALRAPMSYMYPALQRIFPADFVYGINWQLAHNRDGHQAGLWGMYSRFGWWYYFPVAFALKTTLPFLLLSVASLAWGLWRFYRGKDERFLLLLLPFGFFTALVMMSKINIGVRYYLPAYMFLFILSGALLDRVLRRIKGRRAIIAGVVLLFGWMSFETIRAYPDYMPYMNQLASGAPRWYYLSDSNVEWGDDARALALYLRERGETKVGAALLNWEALQPYGVRIVGLFTPPGTRPEETRYVAVGASFLNGSTVPAELGEMRLSEEARTNYFDEYRRRTPEKVFGNSIYLYRMKD
ncbi:MAG TPA: glycosyltransferase family 39 protein [Pyrinomonadaceae bacterium]|nr:glycosyltransferase family 39 protein [Pyrinomonadaceae bacterium]